MSKKEKQVIGVLIGIAVVAIIVVLIVSGKNKEDENIANNEIVESNTVEEEKYVEVLEDGTKLNTSEEFNNEKRYGNLVIRNMQYTEQNGMTVMLADVTNEGSTVHEPEIVTITIYGENNEVITELHPAIGRIEPGETIKINATSTADVANARDYGIRAGN